MIIYSVLDLVTKNRHPEFISGSYGEALGLSNCKFSSDASKRSRNEFGITPS